MFSYEVSGALILTLCIFFSATFRQNTSIWNVHPNHWPSYNRRYIGETLYRSKTEKENLK